MRPTDEDIAREVLGCSPAMLSLVLSGKRRFSFSTAQAAAQELGGGLALWIDPEGDIKERRELVEAFKDGFE